MDLYFDNAATTKISERALSAYTETARTVWANPSSVHKPGLEAKRKLEEERTKCAALLGIKSEQLFFTSGATESIAAVFSSLLFTTPGKIIISKIEHEALASWLTILKQYGWKTTELKAKNGFVSSAELEKELTPDTKMVAVMAVNNVTGAIQPIKELVSIAREYEKTSKRKIFFFSDSVQALGKIPYNMTELGIDGASFSGHKINGPRGIGMLYLKNPSSFRPLAPAGGQEKGKRGGTENLPAISALRVAIEEWMDGQEEKNQRVQRMKERIIAAIKETGFEILSPEKSSPYIISFSSSLPSEVYTRILSDKGVYVSSGSACSNNAKGEGEKILLGMGIRPEKARNAVRISLSNSTTEEETEALIKIIKETGNGR